MDNIIQDDKNSGYIVWNANEFSNAINIHLSPAN